MVRSVKLFLIRHGETVDNVAQLYAGSRDSELTNHGSLQIMRLGLHFQTTGILFTHLFSSPLQRAARTAGKIREAQLAVLDKDDLPRAAPDVVQLSLLAEQDFGSMEGKKWHDRGPGSEVFDAHRSRPEKEFVDLESKGRIARRADIFLDDHFLPLLDDALISTSYTVAVVSHGIFLSILWKRLLLRLPPKSVTLCSELRSATRPLLEHLGGWSNTGYLELHMIRTLEKESKFTASEGVSSVTESSVLTASHRGAEKIDYFLSIDTDETSAKATRVEAVSLKTNSLSRSHFLRIVQGWDTTILTINGKSHLRGLKRTRGGIGSSRYDSSQRNIDTFFKRRKTA